MQPTRNGPGGFRTSQEENENERARLNDRFGVTLMPTNQRLPGVLGSRPPRRPDASMYLSPSYRRPEIPEIIPPDKRGPHAPPAA